MPQVKRPPLETCLVEPEYYYEKGLRKVVPYSYTYMTYAKERWLGRTIEEVFCTEFRCVESIFLRTMIQKNTIHRNGFADIGIGHLVRTFPCDYWIIVLPLIKFIKNLILT